MSVPDAPRLSSYNPVSPTTTFAVGFPMFADGRFETGPEYSVDLDVYVDEVKQIGNWSLDATFMAGVDAAAHVVADAPGWTGNVKIVGDHNPSRTNAAQFVEGRGVSAAAFNLQFNLIWATMREIFEHQARGPTYGPAGNPIDFGGSRLTGVGNGTGATDVLNKAQIQAMVATIVSGGIANAASLITFDGTHSGWGSTVQNAINNAYDALQDVIDDVADHETRIDALEGAAAILLPIGTIALFPGGSSQPQWLRCDGDTIGKIGSGADHENAGFSTLFNILKGMKPNVGTEVFASGDKVHLPDFSGRVPIGADNANGSAKNISQRSTTLDINSGSPNATVGSATGLCVGMFIFAANVPAGTKITAIDGLAIVMSANATAATTVAARFSMINDPQLLGGVGGDDVHSLIDAQMPLHGHAARFSLNSGSTSDITGGLMVANDTETNEAEFTGTPGTPAGHQIGGTGDDQPHPNMQPSLVVHYLIYAGV